MANIEPKTLGAYLRAARMKEGLSIRKLAAADDINNSYVVKLETDQNDNPSAAHLQRLADVLEIDASVLLAFIGVEPSSLLPPPRIYFRRKFGLSDAEAARLSKLIAEHTNKPPNQGDRHQ